MKVELLQEIRADEGIYAPLIQAMQKDSRFDLEVIHKWSWRILKTPNWLIVLGDRRAMLEATLQAAYLGTAVAHIHGGDRSGTIDEPARHAITAFAHLHFPCTQHSADRLMRMGEESWRIKVVGPLGIYAMPKAQFIPKHEISWNLGLEPGREIVLVIQHPVTTQINQSGEQMRTTLKAVKGLQTVVIYPNNDPGAEDMIREIDACDWIRSFKNLPYLQFVSLLKACDVIVGNSSCAIYEAPLFGIPAVNIGDRQQGREHAENVIDCPHDAEQIQTLINYGINMADGEQDNYFKPEVDGVKVILDTLANTPIDEKLMQKRLTY